MKIKTSFVINSQSGRHSLTIKAGALPTKRWTMVTRKAEKDPCKKEND